MERPEARPSLSARLSWVAPFIALFLVQLVHHQLWRDELNAWGIAVAAPDLRTLIHYIHYEGHPALWYLLLWPAARFTTSPVAMKLIEAAIGVSVYLVLARYSPFNRWQNILLACSYFISFEYTVLARMYGLTLLFVLLYLANRTQSKERIIPNFCLLALTANTDLVGLLVSGALAVEYLAELIRLHGWQKKTAWLGLSLYVAGLAITFLTLQLSPDITWRDRYRLFESARSLPHLIDVLIDVISVPWFPIADDFPRHWWNPLVIVPTAHPVLVAAVPVILISFVLLFREHRWLLSIVLSTIAGSVAVNHLIYLGSIRHFGAVFLAFLAALWLLRLQVDHVSNIAYLFLGLSAFGGVLAAYAQWHHPFSQAFATAAWLHSEGLDRELILATPDTGGAAIAEELERPYYALDCDCINTFVLYSRRRDHFVIPQIPDRLRVAQTKLHRDTFTLVTIYPIVNALEEDLRRQGFRVEPLRSFTGAEEPGENYFVYRVICPKDDLSSLVNSAVTLHAAHR